MRILDRIAIAPGLRKGGWRPRKASCGEEGCKQGQAENAHRSESLSGRIRLYFIKPLNSGTIKAVRKAFSPSAMAANVPATSLT